MSVDLPTLGNPTRATSASSFSSSRSQRSSPTSPCSAKAGARRRFDRNRALPRPPRPPSPASQRSPAPTRSASTVAVLVADDGALGHRHLEVGAAAAVLALALAVGAAAGRPVRVVLEGDQRGHVAVDDEPHVAAVAAVAAVGAALGHVGLAPEADRARAAVATLDVETALVDELRHPARLPSAPGRSGRSRLSGVAGEVDRVALDPGLPGGDVVGDALPRTRTRCPTSTSWRRPPGSPACSGADVAV